MSDVGCRRPEVGDRCSFCRMPDTGCQLNSIMARGWESKAVESQQDEASRRAQRRPDRSPEDVSRDHRRAALEMALVQTQAEMGAACRPAHREMLKLRLAAIQDELAGLS